MNTEIHNCENLLDKPPSFFFQEGILKGKNILILGESLARNGWVESGKAFYTSEGKLVPTGKRLNEELAVVDLRLEDCAFTEIAKCYIGTNRKILASCGLKSKDHLMIQIKTYKPKLIISLGVVTKDVLQKVFGAELKMGEMSHIKIQDINVMLLPLYHPSPANPYGHAKNMTIIKESEKEIKQLSL